ncbi:MAG: hypothetical protein WB441_13430 [Nocardioidaceae bacterium]
MSFALRHLLVAGAVSALVAAGAGPAAADVAPTTTDCDTATAAVATATSDLESARAAFKAANRPLGKVMADERREARTEVRTSTEALRELRRQARATRDRSARHELEDQIKAERRDVARSVRLLGSKRALLAKIKADRAVAKAAFVAAKVSLASAEHDADDVCADPESSEPTTDSPEPAPEVEPGS